MSKGYLHNVKFLVVDDNAFMRTIIRRVLGLLEVDEVRDVANGEAAIKMLESFEPDIIITDWMMGPINGIELTKIIRTSENIKNPFTPIIMLSAHSDISRIYEARDAGINEFVVKPISVKSAPLKAQPNPLEEFSPAARKATEDVVADYYDMFLDVVEERRKLPRDTVKALADGRVFSGRQALANGLIDAIGAETEARKWLDETHKIAESLPVQDVEVGDDDEPWRKWVDSKIEKVLFSERLSLDGVISLWQPNLW